MKMMTKQTIIRWLKRQIKHAEFSKITLLTFKKDRQITVINQNGSFTVVESGYKHQTFEQLDAPETIKQLKQLLAFEFPRSHQVYVEQN